MDENLPFKTNWIFWIRDPMSSDWTINSYKNIFKIKNIHDFWSIFDNVYLFDFSKYDIFIMREGIEPTWEDPKNMNGGSCSFRIELKNVNKMWELLCMYMMNENLTSEPENINGLSFCTKNNWIIIKIWNIKSGDFADKLHKDIKKNTCDISIRYTPHKPEAKFMTK